MLFPFTLQRNSRKYIPQGLKAKKVARLMSGLNPGPTQLGVFPQPPKEQSPVEVGGRAGNLGRVLVCASDVGCEELIFVLFDGEDALVVSGAGGDQVIYDAGQFMGRRGDVGLVGQCSSTPSRYLVCVSERLT
jgi:hypothetical protein